MLNVAGKDASKQFQTFHSEAVRLQYLPKMLVGDLSSTVGEIAKKEAPAAVTKKNEWYTGANEVFGDLAPFAEPGSCRFGSGCGQTDL